MLPCRAHGRCPYGRRLHTHTNSSKNEDRHCTKMTMSRSPECRLINTSRHAITERASIDATATHQNKEHDARTSHAHRSTAMICSAALRQHMPLAHRQQNRRSPPAADGVHMPVVDQSRRHAHRSRSIYRGRNARSALIPGHATLRAARPRECSPDRQRASSRYARQDT